MSHTTEEHARYLEDSSRLIAFRRGMEGVLRPDSVVLDLGSGTGILGLLAAQARAARVYCIDQSRMLGVARQIVESSGFSERFSFLAGHSTEVELPERVDLVVADQMAPFGFGAGLLSCFADARRRFLKPGGALMPSHLQLSIAGARVGRLAVQLEAIDSNTAGLDLSPMRRLMLSDLRWLRLEREHVVTEPGGFASIELGEEEPEQLIGTLELRAVADGEIDGIAGWFAATLAPGVEMTNSPLSEHRIDRECLFLPLASSVRLRAGESLRVHLVARPRGRFFAWHVERFDEAGKAVTVSKQTSLPSLLLGKKELQQTAPDFVPRLNARGRAQRTVLELCDEARPLSEIIDVVAKRHPEKLPTRERAAEFVQQVLGGLVR